MRSIAVAVLLVLGVGLASAPAAHANLVQNGTFGQGSTDWTLGGTGGNFYCCFAGYVNAGGTLSQVLTTTPGDEYSFFVSVFTNAGGCCVSSQPYNYGLSAVDVNTATPLASASGISASSYTLDFVAIDSSTRIVISGAVATNITGNVDVEDIGPVPEPATLALLGTGLAGLALRGRRVRRRTAHA